LRQTPIRATIASERLFTITLGCQQPQQTLAWITLAVELREQGLHLLEMGLDHGLYQSFLRAEMIVDIA